MDIGAISQHTFPSVGYAINAVNTGKKSIPVHPSMVIYSHFKHISGTPAPEGTQGVNISKLKILDTMIEQLSRMKKQSAVNYGTVSEQDERRINALIEQYQRELKTAQASPVYTPVSPVAGLLFNISV